MPKILVIDDELDLRVAMSSYLEQRQFKVVGASSCKAAVEEMRSSRPDAVILDSSLPDGAAMDLLQQLHAIEPFIPIIFLTEHATIELAVTAIKLGAEQFLTKPVELPGLAVMLERALDKHWNRQNHTAGVNCQACEQMDPFCGESELIRRLADAAHRIAFADCPVLINGETGAGKGVLARWLHVHGPRSKAAFVDINCAGFARDLLENELFGHEKGSFTGAISAKQGLFEVSHRGTIFLDEIGDMDLQLQPKLLKVLEEKRFRRIGDVRDRILDTRLIAATHQDLSEMVGNKRFRADLYFRINTVVLRVPPLRERPQDIHSLAQAILRKTSAEMGKPSVRLSPEAAARLRQHSWPGNVRELRNTIERALLLSDMRELQPCHLQFEAIASPERLNAEDVTLEALERQHIARVLAAENGHVDKAAVRLGLPRSTMYSKLKVFGLGSPRAGYGRGRAI